LEGPEQRKTQTSPAGCEPIQIDTLAVKQVQETVIGRRTKAKDADEAGDAGKIHAAAETHQDHGHPQEGACAAACGPESAYRLHPCNPERHGKVLREIVDTR
jgi:hypothetical protein